MKRFSGGNALRSLLELSEGESGVDAGAGERD